MKKRRPSGANRIAVEQLPAVEHTLKAIKTADWIVDLGPEGGDAGGYVVAVGTPEEIAASASQHSSSQ